MTHFASGGMEKGPGQGLVGKTLCHEPSGPAPRENKSTGGLLRKGKPCVADRVVTKESERETVMRGTWGPGFYKWGPHRGEVEGENLGLL